MISLKSTLCTDLYFIISMHLHNMEWSLCNDLSAIISMQWSLCIDISAIFFMQWFLSCNFYAELVLMCCSARLYGGGWIQTACDSVYGCGWSKQSHTEVPSGRSQCLSMRRCWVRGSTWQRYAHVQASYWPELSVDWSGIRAHYFGHMVLVQWPGNWHEPLVTLFTVFSIYPVSMLWTLAILCHYSLSA